MSLGNNDCMWWIYKFEINEKVSYDYKYSMIIVWKDE